MNIVVTGSEGFIGKHLIKAVPRATRFDLTRGQDILIGDIPQSDIVIHLAACASVPLSIEDPLFSYQTNVVGTIRVLEYCRKYKAKLIFTSSCQASPDAENPYGLQKYHCEQLIKQYGKLYGVEYLILRLYNVFGEREHGVIGKFLQAKKNGRPLQIYGGQQKRDMVHVDAVVEAILSGLEKNATGIRSVGSGLSISVQDIADMISPDQEHYDLPKGEPLNLCSIDAVPTISVEEYIKSV